MVCSSVSYPLHDISSFQVNSIFSEQVLLVWSTTRSWHVFWERGKTRMLLWNLLKLLIAFIDCGIYSQPAHPWCGWTHSHQVTDEGLMDTCHHMPCMDGSPSSVQIFNQRGKYRMHTLHCLCCINSPDWGRSKLTALWASQHSQIRCLTFLHFTLQNN